MVRRVARAISSARFAGCVAALFWILQLLLHIWPWARACVTAASKAQKVHFANRRARRTALVGDVSLEKPSLDERQREAMDAMFEGRNVLITGCAGVGKSFVITQMVEALKEKFGDRFEDAVALTASTGSAASHVSGTTLHSLMGPGVPAVYADFAKIDAHIWKDALEVLLIDEASMISGEFFDLLESEVRNMRGVDQAFGGLQVILAADFFQLSPVANNASGCLCYELDEEALRTQNRALCKLSGPKQVPERERELFLNRGMIFQSDAFWSLHPVLVELATPHRQSTDPEFAAKLLDLREGRNLEETITWLNRCCCVGSTRGDTNQLTLVPTRKQAYSINSKHLYMLSGKCVKYLARDSVDLNTAVTDLDSDLSTTVTDLDSDLNTTVTDLDSVFREFRCERKLVLKVDAKVMLTCNIDIRAGLVNGCMGRVEELFNDSVIVDFDGAGLTQVRRWPFTRSLCGGVGNCVRSQIPLRLAWAVTHHSSQGLTLNSVTVDPRSFAKGQLYVALSRAKKVSGLQLIDPLCKDHVLVEEAAVAFNRYVKSCRDEQKGGSSASFSRRARPDVGHWRDIKPAVKSGWRRWPAQ